MSDAWERRSRATAAHMAVELLGEHFTDQQSKLDKDIFTKLDRGLVISPDEALQFIAMKYANYKLSKKLHQELSAGQTANAQLAPMFNREGANGE